MTETTEPNIDWANQLLEILDLDGEPDIRVRVLLWLARSVFDRDDLDSYQDVFLSPLGLTGGSSAIDGYITHVFDDTAEHVLLAWVGTGDSRADGLRNVLALVNLMSTEPASFEASLMSAPGGPFIVDELRRAERISPIQSWKIVAVSPQAWTTSDRNQLRSDRIDMWDPPRMSAIASARRDPNFLSTTLDIRVSDDERLLTSSGPRRVFVAPVPGADVADWPGIDDRRLFDLNVRFSLGGRTRVRRSLDEALGDADQSDFLASHNGLTVLCREVREYPDRLEVQNISVVNGAQSVIALHDNKASIESDLKVLVKFVELGQDDALARLIAVRSNTQNPVSGRNLRALDQSQIDMSQSLSDRGYYFDTRPDAGRGTVPLTIRNDDAAQWICTVYLQRPWLAVKRNSLFTPEIFQEIYGPDREAEQLILLYSLRQEVDATKDAYPADMRRAWLLTALTAMYLAGQILRADETTQPLLLEPATHEGDSKETKETLRGVAAFVASELVKHSDQSASSDTDFRTDFKRQRTLLDLASRTSKAWRLARRAATT